MYSTSFNLCTLNKLMASLADQQNERSQIQKLIELYRQSQLLWDETHVDYYNRPKRQQRLVYISSVIGMNGKCIFHYYLYAVELGNVKCAEM